MQKEAKARIKINNLLQQAGWRFFDDEHGKANIVLENHIKITKRTIDEFGNDFEKTKHGFIDFLLLDEKGFPLIVLEAKSEDKDPLIGKEQARTYANAQNVRFILLSNGNIHYLWDKALGNPTHISHFPSVKSLAEKTAFVPDMAKLVAQEIQEDYVALTQQPHYYQDPRWIDGEKREQFVIEAKLKFLRQYQVIAVKKNQEAVREGKNRFCLKWRPEQGRP